jgi:hypothetical protein
MSSVSVRWLASKRLIQGQTEGIPQFLFLFAIQRHGVRLLLPTLLKGFDSIHAQGRRTSQGLGFGDQRLTTRHTGFLCYLPGLMRRMNDGFPLGL